MSYPINYPTPQGANVQIFNCTDQLGLFNSEWVKPQGASFVWFTLIGGGGAGDGTQGGGSGAVTNFMCPAFLIPDVLQLNAGRGGKNSNEGGRQSIIVYQQKDGTGYTLLTAGGGSGGTSATGGSAMNANYFTAMGFFQSIAGQAGTSGVLTASATTFLTGGTSVSSTITANYGYSISGSSSVNANGIFQTQPIIVGIGGVGAGRGGIGCGGGASNSAGGDGLIVIITW